MKRRQPGVYVTVEIFSLVFVYCLRILLVETYLVHFWNILLKIIFENIKIQGVNTQF
jgi:hypothetical protein